MNGAGGIRTNAHIGANSSVLLYLGQHYGGVIRTADIALKIYCLEPGHLLGRPLDNLHHGIVAGACGHLSVIHIVILEVIGLCSALQNIEDPLARVFGDRGLLPPVLNAHHGVRRNGIGTHTGVDLAHIHPAQALLVGGDAVDV